MIQIDRNAFNKVNLSEIDFLLPTVLQIIVFANSCVNLIPIKHVKRLSALLCFMQKNIKPYRKAK